jgi:hypothetical protein
MMSKSLVALSLMGVLCAAFALPGSAAVTTFDPSLQLWRVYTSNALFSSSEEAVSDSYTALSLFLPVARKTPRSFTRLTYSPSYQGFDSLDSLDNLTHRVLLEANATPTEASTIDISTLYYKGQDQVRPDASSDPNFVLTPRNSREQGRVELDYTNRITGQWNWGARTYYEDLRYSFIDDTDEQPDSFVPQDRTAIGVEGRIGRNTSLRTSTGLEIGFDRFDLDVSGQEDVQRLSLFLNHAFSRRNQLELQGGGFQSEIDRKAPLEPGQDNTRSGFYGRFDFVRVYSGFNLRLFASHRPTSGYDFVGTSTNSIAGLTFNPEFSDKLAGDATIRYLKADSTFGEDAAIENIGVGGNLGYRPFRTLSFRFSAWVSSQTGSGRLGESTSADISVFEGSIAIVWNPLAGKPIAGGGDSAQGEGN